MTPIAPISLGIALLLSGISTGCGISVKLPACAAMEFISGTGALIGDTAFISPNPGCTGGGVVPPSISLAPATEFLLASFSFF